MEHSYASEHHLVEQYLLDELSPAARDEFEEHFFDCRECAAELKVTSEFLQLARSELQRQEFAAAQASAQTSVGSRAWSALQDLLQWRPVVAFAVLATCLVVVVYQNSVTLPRLRSEVARLDTPAVLPTISLVGGNSRGGSLPSAKLNGATSIVLQVDIPTQDGISAYTCSLYSPQHRLVWSFQVTAEAAKDTVFLHAPLGGNPESGTYTLAVRGNKAPGTSAGPDVDVARYDFNLNTVTSKSGQ